MRKPFYYQRSPEDNYQVHYVDKVTGKRKTLSTGTKSPRAAKEFFDKFLESYESISPVKNKAIRFSQFRVMFLEAAANYSKSSLNNINQMFGQFLKYNPDKLLEDYTTYDIDKYIRFKLDTASAQTANNHKRFLSLIFNKAVDWDILKVNVVKKAVKIKLPEPDPVIFTKEDFRKLINATSMQKYKDLFTFAVLTGLRMNELIHLKSDHIDIENKLIKVLSDDKHKTKTGRTRYVELNALLIPIATKIKVKEYPFGEFNKWMLKDAMNRYIKKAKINPRYSFKSFRSTCGKWLLDEGVNIKYISQMLGHSSVVTTEKHYAKYITAEKKGWVNKVTL